MGTRSSRVRSFSREVAAIVVAGVLVLGACSDDDSSDSGNTSGQTSESSAATTTDPTEPPEGVVGEPLERYADYESINYVDGEHWLCRPDTDDFCDANLDSTVVHEDGTLTVEPFVAAQDPPIDCFYVYPTISGDPTITSDWEPSAAEEGYTAVNQAARLQSQCRLFAPVYRQNTLTSLGSSLAGGEPAPASDDPPESSFADVLDAFRTYMANDNNGRGFVLIGHSQGAAMLNQLIAEEIDPNEDVREAMVAAYLAGWSVAVPEGSDVGGDFDNVAVCTLPTQIGCVVSWVSFRATAPPPPTSFFGRPRSPIASSENADIAACASPADLAGNNVELHSYFPANRTASLLSGEAEQPTSDDQAWLPSSVGEITTPFVSVPGLVSGSCVFNDGFNYLSVDVHPEAGPRADDIGGDLTPDWGLHLVDVNLVMGDIISLVETQSLAFVG